MKQEEKIINLLKLRRHNDALRIKKLQRMIYNKRHCDGLNQLISNAINVLGRIKTTNPKQAEATQNAIQLIKKIPYLRKKDLINGTDSAFDAAGHAMDILHNAKVNAKNVGIDDIIDIINK